MLQAASEGRLEFQVGEPSDVDLSAGTQSVEVSTSVSFGARARVLVKMTLNYLCYRLGPSAVLAPAFDPMRRYARYGEGRLASFVVLRSPRSTERLSMASHIIYANPVFCSAAIWIEGVFVGSVGLPPIGNVAPMTTMFDPTDRTHEDVY